jgi:lipopolysaccharide transport system permease protein
MKVAAASTTGVPQPAAEWIITSEVPGPLGTLREVWTHRGLLYFLAARTLRKIYRRTLLGWMWLFIIPLFPIALRTLVFGGLLGVTSQGIPYFLFLLVGQLTWDLFAMGLTWGTRGLELHGGVQDVYVPRIIMPLGAMGPALLDLAIKIGVLALVAAYFWIRDGRSYIVIGPPLLLAAAALAVTFMFAMAIALFTSVWSERTRDARFALGQVLAIWYLLTPILYPLSSVPERWRGWMLLNPLAPIVDTFKNGVLGIAEPDLRAFGSAALVTVALFVAGIRYFSSRDAAATDAR